ncbi:MAG: hypothetical protein D6805_04160 [Planctomycetota bacterium]|nr:MAG: hypothetical protein D6805_04160 [Planctomycetota bacterium]
MKNKTKTILKIHLLEIALILLSLPACSNTQTTAAKRRVVKKKSKKNNQPKNKTTPSLPSSPPQTSPPTFSNSQLVQFKNNIPYLNEKLLQRHNLQILWTLPIRDKTSPSQNGQLHALYLQDDSLYAFATVSNQKFLIRITRLNGDPKWVYEFPKGINFSPTVYNYTKEYRKYVNKEAANEVFVISKDRLYCLDKKFGIALWSISLGGITPSAPPGVHRDYVYVCGFDDRIYAFSKKYKSERWRFRADKEIIATPVTAPPESRRDIVYVASTDGRVYALNALTGNFAWSQYYQTYKSILAPPVFHQSRLYVASTDYDVYCLNAANGLLEWRYSCEAPIETPPVAIGRTIYVIAKNKGLYSLFDKKITGSMPRSSQLNWKYPPTQHTVWLTNGKILYGEIVSVGMDNLEIILKNGKRLVLDRSYDVKKYSFGSQTPISEMPIQILAKGKKILYVLNQKKEICAINDKNGLLLWKIPAQNVDFFLTNPNYHKDKIRKKRKFASILYLGFKNGWIVALKEK